MNKRRSISEGGRWAGKDEIGPTSLRVLSLILAAPKPPSCRQLRHRLGIRLNAVHFHLLRLRGLGLIAWQDHKMRTVHATCTFIPVEVLP